MTLYYSHNVTERTLSGNIIGITYMFLQPNPTTLYYLEYELAIKLLDLYQIPRSIWTYSATLMGIRIEIDNVDKAIKYVFKPRLINA